MLPFFNRVELLSTIMGHDPDWQYHVPLSKTVPRSFGNMREARDSFVHLSNLAVRFIRDNVLRKYADLVPESEPARQAALLRHFHKWQQVFGSMLFSESITATDLDTAKVFRLHHLVATIWTGVALRRDECKTDEWNHLFEQAVSVAEAYQASQRQDDLNSSPSFLFALDVVSPLWFIVLKCRHPVIRRRGIAVLRQATKREGLWDSQLAVAIAERLMSVEEKDLTALDGSQLPLECDRTHATLIDSTSAEEDGSQKYIITFYFRPSGLYGPWETRFEELRLTPILGVSNVARALRN